ncbi:iron-dependent family alcohol dehydrogenase [Alkalihalobacillus alcalophilus ATCC 27647 = CGMCC 1.3604]|uniref:Alcohol dehydrogenase n=1 Tax=Alkalihalobacillus alcalophilus ATCC 27647 = CGMCC 1.3604 TaxID=1218173 RepID=A0A094YZC3_ALKAL|nr:iron-containing alcohol dehydrogenase [Alkalihalobacillus alcalophilus]KGA98907.1 alcohol dehydrogenase [Alkalihalobacillus alcalophilus ATCC 27647 = CGMCC 1.3604]MED1561939.1 iron-containing alcohol dehydrogenase [Alkalihalobacillus alcalophilus]THG88474.1 iron-dependent family alcohol dehydrogenase [Alkalihalobacillus alcalophilus ATCC 27647 = CGMCC 1.3604]
MTVSSFKSAYKLITGAGATSHVREEVERLQMKNPLIVTDAIIEKTGLLQQVIDLLGEVSYGLFLEVEPEPAFSVIEKCKQMFNQNKHDGFIAIGGGSAIDTAKAVSAYATYTGVLTDLVGTNLVPEKGAPLIAIPTTAGTGSEVTNISILSDKEAQVKKGIVSDYLLPDVAIVSPEMTRTMPASVTAASGIDALVHAIEAYLSVHASPITDSLALGAMKMIAKSLPKAYANPDDMKAREQMATASLMAGMAFGNAGVGAVHALAYPLGGRFNVAHGVSNALLLPFVMKWNKIACIDRMKEIAEALGEQTNGMSENAAADLAIEAMTRLCEQVNIPSSLKTIEISEEDLALMADDASLIDRLLKNNPRRLSRNDIYAIYQEAYEGRSVQ